MSQSVQPANQKSASQIAKTGVIVFQHDDGLAAITHEQLVEIADAIGLTCYQTCYEVVLIDTDVIKPIDRAVGVWVDDYDRCQLIAKRKLILPTRAIIVHIVGRC